MSESSINSINDMLMHKTDINDVVIGPKIGQGQFSTVFIGSYFGDLVAIKKQNRNIKELETYLLRELRILQHLRSAEQKYFVSFIGAYDNTSNDSGDSNNYSLFILTEYCQGGDLLSLLLNSNSNGDRCLDLGLKFRTKLALEAAYAVHYLHENNFLHRDIKSENFLLDHHWTCKLTDFGLSRMVVDPSMPSRMTICGTKEYTAPEMHFEDEYTSAVDIFSLGMVLIEIITQCKIGEKAFVAWRPQNKFRIMDSDWDDLLSREIPQSLVLLAQQCTSYDYNDRPMSAEVIDWLKDFLDSLPEDSQPPPVLPPVEQLFRRIEESSSCLENHDIHYNDLTDGFEAAVDAIGDDHDHASDKSDYGEELSQAELTCEFGFDVNSAMKSLATAAVETTASVDPLVFTPSSQFTPYLGASSDSSLSALSMDYSCIVSARSLDGDGDHRCGVGLQRRATAHVFSSLCDQHEHAPNEERQSISAPNSARYVLAGLSLADPESLLDYKHELSATQQKRQSIQISSALLSSTDSNIEKGGDEIESDPYVLPVSALKKRLSRRRISMERSSPKLTAEQIRQFHSVSLPGDNSIGDSGTEAYSDGAPRRFGFLSKLNAFGFRTWRKYLFMLTRTKLSYVNSDNSTTKSITLCGCQVKRTREFRFQIVNIANPNENSFFCKELAADSLEIMKAWIADIELAIAEADAKFLSSLPSANKSPLPLPIQLDCSTPCLPQDNFKEENYVKDWLASINLSQYESLLVGHPVFSTTMATRKDFDFCAIGVTNPLHRLLLQNSFEINPPYLHVAITGARQFDSVTVYMIKARYRLFKSCICLRYTDFKRFDVHLRNEMKRVRLQSGDSSALPAVPSLPAQGLSVGANSQASNGNPVGARKPVFTSTKVVDQELLLHNRQQALQAYLVSLSANLHDTPYFNSVLYFLELLP